MSMMSPRTGRPLKIKGQPLDRLINVRVSASEHARLKAEARRRGIKVSDLLMKPWRKVKGG